MKRTLTLLALALLVCTACAKSEAKSNWICPECGCHEGSTCGCSPDNGCKCKEKGGCSKTGCCSQG